ncbi:hypothetical protein METBIDRAFT_76763 [Metschnikowia bicuspidata var. bicuspidata NRRL YB-4993]|uniref:glucan 1,3-beta-glucosidase n=1 Tax=Metschnikowia bicuspidata var. bicuspidata NRRL YB-4993 TaxID=869754 RepID=A0A1A0HII2_9ASCO|nr:hypothetical protein METBIDRAFT_76763 [Metschnikowia bicuspidata var. bicuspidata NRRL YB-4993]OBA23820.1 hypothetical protein METBIDRAFT_76763 [Metschnikowia bicuspidata var. bicuspidata NRRL YB-4993]
MGVALGGWLLLEPFITPSLFLAFNETSRNSSDIPTDEYTYCQQLGRVEAAKRLETHWLGFYNESDFRDIKSYGFNMVRIPIGYWAFDMLDDDPYVSGAQAYLDLAIDWAHKYDLKVWIDLHGAPGSQNGFDNSGRFLDHVPGWQNSLTNIELTELVLRQIYEKYGGASFSERYNDTIIGIEVLNEPFGPKLSMADLELFYTNTYLDARLLQATNNTIVFHDAFQALGYWDGFLNSTGNMPGRLQNYNILIDHHHYEIFFPAQLSSNISEHISSIRHFASGIYDERHAHPAVVGEWSAALTDCTPWLNTVGRGSRWEGTAPFENDPINITSIGNCSDINNWALWSAKHKENTRKYIEIQLDQYESKLNGWIFWTYKTETTIEWDFRRLAQFGLFPQPFSDRQYIVNGTDTKPETSGGPIF